MPVDFENSGRLVSDRIDEKVKRGCLLEEVSSFAAY